VRASDWNVVLSVCPGRAEQARRALDDLGEVHQSDRPDLLLMEVENGRQFFEALRTRLRFHPELAETLASVAPVGRVFAFESARDFEQQTGEAVLGWVDELANQRFRVRLHRWGDESQLSVAVEERALCARVLEESQALGRPARVDLDDPDWIILVEVVGKQAGLSLWTREERRRYALLAVD